MKNIPLTILGFCLAFLLLTTAASAVIFREDTGLFANGTTPIVNNAVGQVANTNGAGWVVQIKNQDVQLIQINLDRSFPGTSVPNNVKVSAISCSFPPNTVLSTEGPYPVNSGVAVFYNGSQYKVLSANTCYLFTFYHNTTAWVAPSYYNVGHTINGTFLNWLVGFPAGSNATSYYQDVFKQIYLNVSAVNTSNSLYPFTVIQNSSQGLTSIQKVTVGFNNTNDVYNYALACDISGSPLWGENFGLNYNFTQKNVNINYFPPESFLVFDGLQINLNASNTELDIQKEYPGVRDAVLLKMDYTSASNRSWDVLVFSNSSLLTEYWRFNVTGTNLLVSKVVPGQGIVTVGTLSNVTGTRHIFQIQNTPITDSFTGTQYFSVTITFDGSVVGSTSTFQFSGSDIGNTEFFTSDVGLVDVHSISAQIVNNPTPQFSLFQNGQVQTVGGVTVTTDPLISPVDGDGFTILPSYNEVFYSTCTYSRPGTYKQRHYISSTNENQDYTNFKEITVVVSNTTDITSLNPGSGDIFTDKIPTLFASLGFKSQASAFLLWMIIIIALSAGIYVGTHSSFMTIITFVTGLVIGIGFFVPIWVVAVLVIIAGAILAITYKNIFGGNGQGG